MYRKLSNVRIKEYGHFLQYRTTGSFLLVEDGKTTNTRGAYNKSFTSFQTKTMATLLNYPCIKNYGTRQTVAIIYRSVSLTRSADLDVENGSFVAAAFLDF